MSALSILCVTSSIPMLEASIRVKSRHLIK